MKRLQPPRWDFVDHTGPSGTSAGLSHDTGPQQSAPYGWHNSICFRSLHGFVWRIQSFGIPLAIPLVASVVEDVSEHCESQSIAQASNKEK
jgi:hypothetical protein